MVKEELISNILVPVDGSEASKKAIEYSAWVASKTGAKITLLNVIDEDKMQFNFEAMDRFLPEWEDKVKRSNDIKKYSPYYDEERKFSIEDPLCKQGNNILKEMAQYAEKLGVKPKTEVKLGKFVNTVIDVAQKGKYDQIIVGKTDFVGNKGLPTDNVFEKIAKYADCRVSVIPA